MRDRVRRVVLDGLHAQGIQVDDCINLGGEEARGATVFLLGAGSSDFVKRVGQDKGGRFLLMFDDRLEHSARPVASGSGTIPGL
jgi:hypothetical protein